MLMFLVIFEVRSLITRHGEKFPVCMLAPISDALLVRERSKMTLHSRDREGGREKEREKEGGGAA